MAIEIRTITRDDLHAYHGEPCCVELDLEEGSLALNYDYNADSTLPAVRKGLVRRYEIPPLVTDVANGLLEELQPLTERIAADWAMDWEGSRKKVVLGEDAQDAEEEIEEACGRDWSETAQIDVWSVDNGATNGNEVSDHKITSRTTDEELEEVAETIRQELERCSESGQAALDPSLLEYLKGLRDELAEAAADDE